MCEIVVVEVLMFIYDLQLFEGLGLVYVVLVLDSLVVSKFYYVLIWLFVFFVVKI